ncbi:hypothetical protein E2C01_083773 [Portunus trituberculatus]|uniref:Uncharacterized protein n=1 Tax=Portunus trituberculatus TaxID=210409 RepID=A0A5B7ITB6_PORTR|nr:hypothetical protein [Portunus trituberculatus]
MVREQSLTVSKVRRSVRGYGIATPSGGSRGFRVKCVECRCGGSPKEEQTASHYFSLTTP